MVRHNAPGAIGLAVLALVGPGIGVSAGAVVYDNTATPTTGDWTPAGFWAFNSFHPGEPMGDEITLAGTERTVFEFRLLLSSSEPTVLSSLTVTFRRNDAVVMGGYPFGPGTELWSTTLSNVAVNGPTTMVFNVTSVVVPDRFTWLASADSEVAGLATCDPPTTGSSGDYFWNLDSEDDEWYALGLENQVANFGAQVLAVPEPACLCLLLVGALTAPRRPHRQPRSGR